MSPLVRHEFGQPCAGRDQTAEEPEDRPFHRELLEAETVVIVGRAGDLQLGQHHQEPRERDQAPGGVGSVAGKIGRARLDPAAGQLPVLETGWMTTLAGESERPVSRVAALSQAAQTALRLGRASDCLAVLAQRARLRLAPRAVVAPICRLTLRPGDTLPMLVELRG